MGVHHAWGRTLKDIIQRYQAMNGRQLRWQGGFDCEGLWVEVEVEKALGFDSKREIEAFGLDRFARACRDRVATYARRITAQSARLGMWMDWDRSYYTMTDANIGYIWGFLAECHRRGVRCRTGDTMASAGGRGTASGTPGQDGRVPDAVVRAGDRGALPGAGDAVRRRRHVAQPGLRRNRRRSGQRAPGSLPHGDRRVRRSRRAGRDGRRQAGGRARPGRAVVGRIRRRQPLRVMLAAHAEAGRRERVAGLADLVARECNVKEFRVLAEPGAGDLVTGDGWAVTLDTTITPELDLEGRARDLVRQIQRLRKDRDLAVTARIDVTYPAGEAAVVAALGTWVSQQTLARSLSPGPVLDLAVWVDY
jgi:hypothetical protein